MSSANPPSASKKSGARVAMGFDISIDIEGIVMEEAGV
jgi:hypothetical protein